MPGAGRLDGIEDRVEPLGSYRTAVMLGMPAHCQCPSWRQTADPTASALEELTARGEQVMHFLGALGYEMMTIITKDGLGDWEACLHHSMCHV